MEAPDDIRLRKKKVNKIALLFIAKLFLSYFMLSEFHRLVYSATNPSGRFYQPFVTEHLNYIQWVRDLLMIPAVWCIKIFGYLVFSNATEISVVGGPILRINYDCLGLNVMSFLVAFAWAFPAAKGIKIRMLGLTLLMVYLLNIVRITALALILTLAPRQQGNFTYHHEIFNIIVYVVIFITLYRWINRHPLSLAK